MGIVVAAVAVVVVAAGVHALGVVVAAAVVAAVDNPVVVEEVRRVAYRTAFAWAVPLSARTDSAPRRNHHTRVSFVSPVQTQPYTASHRRTHGSDR